ncbi:hypothetical protein VTN00DRAFT_9509 [Thermoascus crustaceus]|uniref:uncharacterized protein n=1 Tax=Thermoascus crustaceus TaxID=5088 RepID=UPI003742A103
MLRIRDPRDLEPIYSDDIEQRKAVAAQIRQERSPADFSISRTMELRLSFFNQPKEVKERASSSQSRFFNGYKSFGTGWASPTESRERSTIPPEFLADILHEEFVWEKTSNLPDLKSACLTYWRACLTLARRLVGIFALALDLPEDAFDHLTTYPRRGRHPQLLSRVQERTDGSYPAGQRFNFNETVSVLPSCVDAEHPPLFEPISSGEWYQLRFKQEAEAGKTGFPEPIVDK